jgi:hypothetical protein
MNPTLTEARRRLFFARNSCRLSAASNDYLVDEQLHRTNTRRQMRFMVIVKATKSSETGALANEELLAAMGNYDEELAKAGMLGRAGLVGLASIEFRGAVLCFRDILCHGFARRGPRAVAACSARRNAGDQDLGRSLFEPLTTFSGKPPLAAKIPSFTSPSSHGAKSLSLSRFARCSLNVA